MLGITVPLLCSSYKCWASLWFWVNRYINSSRSNFQRPYPPKTCDLNLRPKQTFNFASPQKVVLLINFFFSKSRLGCFSKNQILVQHWQIKWRRHLKKNGNWIDTNFNTSMQMVELGSKIQAISWMFGVPITLLQNHLYGITQSKIKKEGKNVAKMLQKRVKAFVQYVKQWK